VTYDDLIAELEIEVTHPLDLGYQSALYLLGALLPDDRVCAAIGVSHGEVRIDWPALYGEHSFSTGERLVINAAHSLFSGTDDGPGLGQLCTHLDTLLICRVIDAVKVRAGLPVMTHV